MEGSDRKVGEGVKPPIPESRASSVEILPEVEGADMLTEGTPKMTITKFHFSTAFSFEGVSHCCAHCRCERPMNLPQ